mmetsp:Transcript_28785/g.94071  ORF Transcript_28785/g.94071 Transcript_28785/m.94071 type:complete len:208 (-) Transcript_28785:19-642(-)
MGRARRPRQALPRDAHARGRGGGRIDWGCLDKYLGGGGRRFGGLDIGRGGAGGGDAGGGGGGGGGGVPLAAEGDAVEGVRDGVQRCGARGARGRAAGARGGALRGRGGDARALPPRVPAHPHRESRGQSRGQACARGDRPRSRGGQARERRRRRRHRRLLRRARIRRHRHLLPSIRGPRPGRLPRGVMTPFFLLLLSFPFFPSVATQ